MHDVVRRLNDKALLFTVTPGRSGTKLLANLLPVCEGITAAHEPGPGFHYVLRTILFAPEAAEWWLLNEKLPAMLRAAITPAYAETSHVVCKGFIEPMLSLGLRPRFLILRRATRDVAKSMYMRAFVPERSMIGKLFMIGPTDPGTLPLPGWEQLSDYQLCYWYAREMERRQQHYGELLQRSGIDTMNMHMHELTDLERFKRLCEFANRMSSPTIDADRYMAVLKKDQNPLPDAVDRAGARPMPLDIDAAELEVDMRIAHVPAT